MIVRETKPGVFELVTGNPTLVSLDKATKATFHTLLAPSFTDEDRAKFGLYEAEPFTEPEGKVRVGQPRYERQGDKVVQVFDVVDAPTPEPDPLDQLRADVAALAARVAILEAKP